MTEQEIKDILQQQNHFFSSGKTIPAEFRLKQLESLKEAMIRHEADLAAALKEDLGKSRMESYMCEIGLTLSELTWMQKHLRSLMRSKRVSTPAAQFAAKEFRLPFPLRNCADHESMELPGVTDTRSADRCHSSREYCGRKTKRLRPLHVRCHENHDRRMFSGTLCCSGRWRPRRKSGIVTAAF